MKQLSFLIISSLYLIGIEVTLLFPTSIIGDLFIVIPSMLASLILLSISQTNIKHNILIWNQWILLLIFFCSIMLFTSFDFQSLKIIGSIFSVFIVFIYYSTFGTLIFEKTISLVFTLFLILIIFTSIVVSISKNIQGGVFLYSSLLLLLVAGRNNKLKITYWIFFIISTLFVAIYTNYRSLILYVFTLCFLYFIYSRSNGKIIRLITFNGLIVLMFILIAVYSTIDSFDWFDSANDWFIESSGRQIVSGRQEIWPQIIELIFENPLFGSGMFASFSNLNDLELSEHNFYLSFTYKAGFVGLFLLYLSLRSIWSRFISRVNIKYIDSLGMATFIVFLIHNSLEVIMLYNGTVAGLLAWIIIGVSISSIEGVNRER
jgi:O-antigen ligase